MAEEVADIMKSDEFDTSPEQTSFLGVRPRKLRSLHSTIIDPDDQIDSVAPQATFSLGEFAERAHIQGVKDWYHAKSKTAACAYLMILIMFATVTIAQIVVLVREYHAEPIATTIKYGTENDVAYPDHIHLCIEQFIDPRRVAHYMMGSLYKYSNTTVREFATKVFPDTNETLLYNYLFRDEDEIEFTTDLSEYLPENLSRTNSLSWEDTTKLLSNNETYLSEMKQVTPLILYYAKVFNHWHFDEILALLSFKYPANVRSVISGVSVLKRDRNRSKHLIDDFTVTIGDIQDVAFELSFRMQTQHCVTKEKHASAPYLSSISQKRCAHPHPQFHQDQNQNQDTDAESDSLSSFADYMFRLHVHNTRFIDNRFGLCHIVDAFEEEYRSGFLETIEIRFNVVDLQFFNSNLQQFRADQKVLVRLSKDGIDTAEYAMLEMGTVSAISYEAHVWDRKAVGDCIDKHSKKQVSVLGRDITYDEYICPLLPHYWESKNGTNGINYANTSCNCIHDIFSYMKEKPWTSFAFCDEMDVRRGLCNGTRCKTPDDEQRCANGVGQCTYTQPKCAEIASKEAERQNDKAEANDQTEQKRHSYHCLPRCKEKEFTRISTTVLYTKPRSSHQSTDYGYRSLTPTEEFEKAAKDYEHIKDITHDHQKMHDDADEHGKHVTQQIVRPFTPDGPLALVVRIQPRKFNTLIEQSPALTLYRLGSDIGGAFGLWLGASIFSIVHLVLLSLNGLYTMATKKQQEWPVGSK